jgi:hypothetical protein
MRSLSNHPGEVVVMVSPNVYVYSFDLPAQRFSQACAKWAQYASVLHTRPIDSQHGLIQMLNAAMQQSARQGRPQRALK